TRFISLDPYLALRMREFSGDGAGWEQGIINGRVIAEILASTSPLFVPGDCIFGIDRWAAFDVLDARDLAKLDPPKAPVTRRLAVLGSSGLTAWVGLKLAGVKPGETVLVSAATGAVGGVAGQIVRQRGARAIGIAGGPEKCRYAVE